MGRLFFLLAVLTSLSQNIYAQESKAPVKILRITPHGDNAFETEQIVLEFDQDMVPLGNASIKSEDLPIKITPNVKCDWRWLNTRTLACQVHQETKLQKATRYKITVEPTLKSDGGASLDKQYIHEFTTTLPSVSYVSFSEWKSPTKPVIRVYFNIPVLRESVEKSVVMESVGSSGENFTFSVSKPPRDELSEGEEDQDANASKVWDLESRQELAVGSEYRVMLLPGLKSSLGAETSRKKEEVRKFKTFDTFKFLGISCKDLEDKDIRVTSDPEKNEVKKCNPLGPISLVFSSPVPNSQIAKNFTITPDPTGDQQEQKFWGARGEDYSQLKSWAEEEYRFFLPRGLKAASEYTITVKPAQRGFFERLKRYILSFFKEQPETDLEDEFGRKLQSSFEVKVALDHRKPNYEIGNRIAILEKKADSEAPLYVNNLKSARFTYHGFNAAGVINPTTRTYDIPFAQDIQFAIPFNVREMLNGLSGVLYGSLVTDPHVDKGENSGILFAQVTPYQIYVKVGHFNTTLWVTDLATGLPVPQAKITLYKDNLHTLGLPKDILDMGETNEMGVATLLGTADIDPKKKLINAWGEKEDKLFIRIDKDQDLGILPLTYDFLIDTWRVSGDTVWGYNEQKYRHMVSWGTTAQGIYRVGDTIQYKVYIRNQNNRHLTTPPQGKYDLELLDPTGTVIHQVEDINLNDFGSYHGEYKLPKNATIGWYHFRIKAYMPDMAEDVKEENKPEKETKPKPTLEFSPMRVLVSDFTPSPFKVTTDVNGTTFKPNQELMTRVLAKMHAGGAYTEAKAQITAVLDSKTFISKHPVASNFTFGKFSSDQKSVTISQTMGTVNSQGEYETKIKIPSLDIGFGKLTIEGAVYDDRGKSVTSRSVVDFFNGETLIGLRQKEWLYQANKPAEIEYVMVDAKGNPMAGQKGLITVERKDTTAAKVKTAGNVYKTNENNEWVEVVKQEVISGSGAEIFKFTPNQAGTYRITGLAKDQAGAEQSTEIQVYVTGEEFVLWGEETDNYLPLIPEKKDYQVGEKVRILVKNPIPKAKAWITIERFGVIDSFVQELDHNTPVIEFPVKEDYLPNFYVSVVMMTPRSDHSPLKVGQLDMGKPICRIGYTALNVTDAYKKIDIKAQVEKEVYKPREKVRVSLEAKVKNPNPRKEPLELAVVVLDEAVYDMILGGRDYYDPYPGLYKHEQLDLANYSLLVNLVGRQKFEKKGANPGGDGGAGLNMRNIFKFVSYWNPSIITDDEGKASMEFDAPDNLTGWKVLVLGATPTDRLGLGETEFKVNRPTEIRPVMPNLVNEGDQFTARFSVMNRTDHSRTLKVHMEAQGSGVGTDKPLMHDETITLEPYKRSIISMPIKTVPIAHEEEGKIIFHVTAGDDQDKDVTEQVIPVKKIRVMDSMAVSGSLTQGETVLPVAIPNDIHTDVGGLQITLSPSLISNIKGAFDYMKTYPYSCWEQKLSKAVMAVYYQHLKDYLPEEFQWSESKNLPSEVIADLPQFQAGNGGMGYFIADDKFTDPYLSAFTALALNWLKESGHVGNESSIEKLDQYLDHLLRYDFGITEYTNELMSTIRAIILDALSYRQKVTLEDLNRLKSQWSNMSLFGKASFVNAALRTPGGSEMVEDLVKDILSHFNESSGKLSLAPELPETWTRILSTPLRDSCAVLDTLSHYAATSDKAKQLIHDKPEKLVRSIIESRKGKLHWSNTQDNLFCARALNTYSKTYEHSKPNLSTTVLWADEKIGQAEVKDIRDQPITISKKFSDQEPGVTKNLTVRKEGSGILYFTNLIRYASKTQGSKPINTGMEIKRDYSVLSNDQWVLLKEGQALKRGDVVRVDLYLMIPANRNFVVLNDPVPGGLEPVNQNLATSATLSNVNPKPGEGSYYHQIKDWVEYFSTRYSFYFEEMRHDVVRYYSDFLPRGNYHLSYTAQVVADGEFTAPPAFAEEMYNPDIYARGEGSKLNIPPTQ